MLPQHNRSVWQPFLKDFPIKKIATDTTKGRLYIPKM